MTQEPKQQTWEERLDALMDAVANDEFCSQMAWLDDAADPERAAPHIRRAILSDIEQLEKERDEARAASEHLARINDIRSGDLAAAEAEVQRLREALEEIANDAPPSDWEYTYPMCGYDFLGWGRFGDSGYVDDVDGSNSGDVHAHGQAVGRWQAAKVARTALATPQQSEEEG